ncbi:class I SAM-dependent methyltransferase [Streptomyces sp. NPDC088116]|uniref:class I SAM-dependent methyltransferase n=1 Tax=Streptomyces sp. NPDC088116 TaxID=3365825 RepID=UPI003808CC96
MTVSEAESVSLSPEAARAAQYFDSLGLEFQHAFENRKQVQIRAVERLVGRLAPGARVLDAGCGTGVPTVAQLCEAGLDVTGIDVSEVMLSHARRQVPRARFVRADLTSAHLDIGTFDAVVSFFCLIDLPEETFVAALERLRDLAVPGGRVLVAVPEYRSEDEVDFVGERYRPVLCRREEVIAWAGRAGLEVEGLEVCQDRGAQGQSETGLYLWARRPASSGLPTDAPARP